MFSFSSRDFSVRSRAGDQDQEELPVRLREVVTVHGLACGLADGRAMHDGTPHWVLAALVLGHMLKEKRKQSGLFPGSLGC